MRTPQILLATLLAMAGTLALSNCRPAQYEIIRHKNGKDTNKPVKPVNDRNGPENPQTPPETRAGDPAGPVTGDVPPTARVEVIWRNESVVRVKANEPVEIRPSPDTVDPDDIGVSNCANPGIVKAEYEIGAGGEKRSAERAQGCEPLAVPYTFTTTGTYVISMVVTSNESETAAASMTLLVFDGDTPPAEDGGFTIRAKPMLAGVGEVITFWGTCTLGKTQVITWQFADGGTATGRVVTHAYQTTGQYPVEATCTDETGRTATAKVTIVVIDEPGVKIPGNPDPTVPQPDQPRPAQPQPGQPNPDQRDPNQHPNPPRQGPDKDRGPDQGPPPPAQQPSEPAGGCWFLWCH